MITSPARAPPNNIVIPIVVRDAPTTEASKAKAGQRKETTMSAKNAMETGAAAVMPPASEITSIGNPALPLTTNAQAASSINTGGSSSLDEQIERLKRCEYLREGEVKALCLRAREILVDESNVQRVDAPVTVSVQSSPCSSRGFGIPLSACLFLFFVSRTDLFLL